jgi:hypothetical protein
MWVVLILFGLLLLAGFGGLTGRGVYDSRDPAYGLRLPEPKPSIQAQARLLNPNRESGNQ